MYANTNLHLELAKARQADLLREARRHQLAASAQTECERTSMFARVRSVIVGLRPAPRPAPLHPAVKPTG